MQERTKYQRDQKGVFEERKYYEGFSLLKSKDLENEGRVYS